MNAAADVCTPAIGTVYAEPGGASYRVTGYQPDGRVNLQNRARPNAFLIKWPAEINASRYLRRVEGGDRPAPPVLAPAAETAPAASPAVIGGGEQPAPPPPPYVPYWTPPARKEVPTTLGAQRPAAGDRRMPTGPAPYWMRCSLQFAGDTHAWFLSEGATLYCPACRGDDPFAAAPVVRPWSELPPPLDPDHARSAAAAIARTELGPRWWAMVLEVALRDVKPAYMPPEQAASIEVEKSEGGLRHGLGGDGEAAEELLDQVVELAPAQPEPSCADCGITPSRRPVVALFYQDDGTTAFCASCLRRSPVVLERQRREKGEPARPRPPAPPVERPALAPARTRQDDWLSISAGVER